MRLPGLALARATVDRASVLREDPDWIEAAWASPDTRVLVVSEGRALLSQDGSLLFIPPEQAPEGTRFLLGVEPDDPGTAYFGVSGPLLERLDTRPVTLRFGATMLSDRDAGLMTHAVALANWHDSHTHCPKCGSETVVAAAGHLTTCPTDGSQHFPRTDPAVIMLVTDPDDRCLLGRGANWPERRMSVLAGFVEPGESAEMAVVREVMEESGVAVTDVEYLGSQPWPMPRSLMLGFQARAAGGQVIVIDPGEISEARWFSREELHIALETGELVMPPSASIARRIIETWYGADLPSQEPATR